MFYYQVNTWTKVLIWITFRIRFLRLREEFKFSFNIDIKHGSGGNQGGLCVSPSTSGTDLHTPLCYTVWFISLGIAINLVPQLTPRGVDVRVHAPWRTRQHTSPLYDSRLTATSAVPLHPYILMSPSPNSTHIETHTPLFPSTDLDLAESLNSSSPLKQTTLGSVRD